MTTLSQLWPLHMAVVPFFLAAGQFLLVTAGAFVVLVLVSSFFRFHFMMVEMSEGDEEESPSSEDEFHLAVMQRLGTAHRAPEPFAILLLKATPKRGVDSQSENVQWLGELVAAKARETLRESDAVYVREDGTIAAVIDASPEHINFIVQRVHDGLANTTHKSVEGYLRFDVCAGCSTCPENGERLTELVGAAADALVRAEGQGVGVAMSEHASEWHDEAAAEVAEKPEEQSALVDPLTGVLRSKYLPKAMPKYIARYRKAGDAVSVLYLDIDRLSRYNEHYGEEAGNALLKGVGELLQVELREDDLISRYGDTDFIMLLGCDARGGLAAGQRVVAVLRQKPFLVGKAQLKISATIGVAGCPDHGTSPRQLFEAAELAMQVAKGKNRGMCMLYDPSMRRQETRSPNVDRF